MTLTLTQLFIGGFALLFVGFVLGALLMAVMAISERESERKNARR